MSEDENERHFRVTHYPLMSGECKKKKKKKINQIKAGKLLRVPFVLPLVRILSAPLKSDDAMLRFLLRACPSHSTHSNLACGGIR